MYAEDMLRDRRLKDRVFERFGRQGQVWNDPEAVAAIDADFPDVMAWYAAGAPAGGLKASA